jgi:predicted MFS family arabinose efflux permease
MIAPLVLVRIALEHNWRWGFFVVTVPGLICASLAARFIREPALPTATRHQQQAATTNEDGSVLEFRNVWLCAALCCFFVAYLGLAFGFLPLFYVNVRHLLPEQMSFLMGLLGVSAVLFAVLLPIASDYFGRKPVMVIASLVGTLCPLAAVFYTGPLPVLACLLFVGWTLSGTASLFTGTIPSETVPAHSVSTAMGLIYGVGALSGGFVGPAIGGWSADHWGLRAPLLIQAGCAAAATVASAGLRETLHRRSREEVRA